MKTKIVMKTKIETKTIAKAQGDSVYPFVVADIGGTNARYGLVTCYDNQTGSYQISQQINFENALHPTFADSLAAYLSALKSSGGNSLTPRHVCIALAAPVTGDTVVMTNLNWRFSITGMKTQFQLHQLKIVNDFTALAYATPRMPATQLSIVKEGPLNPRATKAIIGPGTGLGVSALMPVRNGWLPVDGEGGHTALAPNADEIDLLRILYRDLDYVSAETLLSGPGLVRLYQALAELKGTEPGLAELGSAVLEGTDAVRPQLSGPFTTRKVTTQEIITQQALREEEGLCRQALNIFCALLGSLAGDLALIYGARGGVYLGGGILPKIENFLLHSDFVKRFSNKGLMSHYLQDIPVYLITAKQPTLLGAAALMAEQAVD